MRQDEYREATAAPDGTHEVRVREQAHWISPGRVISFLAGLALAIVGVTAIVRGGIDGSLNVPLVDAFGMTQSALVGVIELVTGLVLIGCSASEAARPVIGFVGVLAILAGVGAVAASPDIQANVGFAGNRTGWFVAVCGVFALLGAVLPSVMTHRHDVRDVRDVDAGDARYVRHA
jgi:hypothetical protein